MPKRRFNITPRDIGTWFCTSEGKPKELPPYIVDVIELTCSCPAFSEGTGCKHLEATLAFVLEAEQHNPAPVTKLFTK